MTGAGRSARLVILAVGLLSITVVGGAVLMSQEDALAAAFGDAEVKRLTEFLDESQVERIEELGGSELDSRVVIRYRGVRDDAAVGTAYFDSHVVRTLPEAIMVLVGPESRVVRVDILSFDEPPDYLPRLRWFEQFVGVELGEELSLKQGIRGVTGATLSSLAVTGAVRRLLAIHRVLEEVAPEADDPPSEKKRP